MALSKTSVLVGAGSGAFLVTLLLGLPAAVAVDWFAPEGAQVSGATGTLWRGAATTVNVGTLRLGQTRWQLSPLALLRGRVGAALETRLGEAEFAGDLSFGAGGAIGCESCRFSGPLASLQAIAPALRGLSGKAELTFASLSIRDRWPVEAVGTLRFNEVPITAPGVPPGPGAPTSSIEATVNAKPVPDDGLIELLIQDGGGPLELSGQIALRPPGTYEITGRAKARPQAPPDMVNALNFLGPKAADGSTEISMSGSI